MAPVNPVRVTERAQKLATEILRPGDVAVDGTAGKGRDTACLAQAVGPTGHVHAFDIQPEAVASTRNRPPKYSRASSKAIPTASAYRARN